VDVPHRIEQEQSLDKDAPDLGPERLSPERLNLERLNPAPPKAPDAVKQHAPHNTQPATRGRRQNDDR
jgi:hypothetical protein